MKKCLIALVIILSMLCSTISASAVPDSNVVLVNPVSNSTIHSNNLLISVKVTEPKKIIVTVTEEKQMINGTRSAVNVDVSVVSMNKSNLESVPVMKPVTFTCTNNLSFYTKQLNNLGEGLYKIQIETIDSTGKVLYTNSSYVVVKDKQPVASENSKIFETPQSGTLQFFQNVLKTIFGK